jgi:P pilus assembly chaperone PapD
MKTKTVLCAALAIVLALTSATHAADISPTEARAIAKEAYI